MPTSRTEHAATSRPTAVVETGTDTGSSGDTSSACEAGATVVGVRRGPRPATRTVSPVTGVVIVSDSTVVGGPATAVGAAAAEPRGGACPSLPPTSPYAH